MFQIQRSMTGMHLKDAKKSDSSITGRMSPWIERKSREPACTAANRSAVRSVLPTRSIRVDQEASPMKQQHRSLNPIMETSHTDLPSVVTDSAVNKVARWLEQIGPPVEWPAYSTIPDSLTGHNTSTSSIPPYTAPVCPKKIDDPSFDISEVAPFSFRTDFLPPSFDSSHSSAKEPAMSGHSSATAKTRVKLSGEHQACVDVLQSSPAATPSELLQEKRDLAYLAVPMQDEHVDYSDTPDYRAVHPSQRPRHPAKVLPPTGGYKSAIPQLKPIYPHRTVRQSHSRGAVQRDAPETKRPCPIIGGMAYSKARPTTKPQYRQHTPEEDIGRRHERNQNVSTKYLKQCGVKIDGQDSGLEETLLAYQAWVRTGRRGGEGSAPRSGPGSENNSGQQHRSNIPIRVNRRTSGDGVGTPTRTAVVNEQLGRKSDTRQVTVVAHQADTVTVTAVANEQLGRISDTRHVTAVAHQADTVTVTAVANEQLGRKSDTRQVTAVAHQADTVTVTAVANEQLGRKSDTRHVTAVAHQADTATVIPRSAISHGNCEKYPDVFGQARRPISGRKVPNDGSVNQKLHQVRGVDRRLIVKNTDKPHPEINESGNIRIHSSGETKPGPSSTSGGISQPGKKSSIRPTAPSPPHQPQRSGQNTLRDSDRKHCPMFAPILAPPCTKPAITCNTSGSNTYRKSSGDEQCNRQRHFDTKPARPTSPSRQHHPGQRSDHNSRSSRDYELKNGKMFAPTITSHHEKPSTSSAKPGSKTYRKTSVDEQFTLQNPVDAKPARPTYPSRQHHPQMSEHNYRSSRDHELKNGPMFAPTQTPHHEKPPTSSANSGSNTYRKSSVDEQFTLQHPVDAKSVRPTFPSRQHHPQMSEHNSRSSRHHDLKNGPMSTRTLTPRYEKPSTSSAKSGSNTYRKSSGDEQCNYKRHFDTKPDRPTSASRPHHQHRSDQNSRSSREHELKNGPMLAPTLTPPCTKPPITFKKSTSSAKSGSDTYRKRSGDEQCNFQRHFDTKPARPTPASRPHHQHRSDQNSRSSRDHELKNGPMFAPTITPHHEKPSTSSAKPGSNSYRKSSVDKQCNFQRPVDKNTLCSRHHEFKNPYKKPSTSSNKSGSSTYRKNAGDTTRVIEPSKAASRRVEQASCINPIPRTTEFANVTMSRFCLSPSSYNEGCTTPLARMPGRGLAAFRGFSAHHDALIRTTTCRQMLALAACATSVQRGKHLGLQEVWR